jgi:hypothetical protein
MYYSPLQNIHTFLDTLVTVSDLLPEKLKHLVDVLGTAAVAVAPSQQTILAKLYFDDTPQQAECSSSWATAFLPLSFILLTPILICLHLQTSQT